VSPKSLDSRTLKFSKFPRNWHGKICLIRAPEIAARFAGNRNQSGIRFYRSDSITSRQSQPNPIILQELAEIAEIRSENRLFLSATSAASGKIPGFEWR
jgi:hypothetical protein